MKTLKLNLQSIENEVEISDGYHTFDELYKHRITLYIALCKSLERHNENVWCSKVHSDGTSIDGWFILGIDSRESKQITYHIPNEYWDEVCSFADIREMAYPFDGHTSNDVLERITKI